MSRSRRAWNQSIYNKYLREGRGQGVGADYNPWIHVQDFSSLGMVSRVSGTTTGRIHHLMSNLELALFYLLDWSDNVLDIREQYPLLNITQAVEIAENSHIKYPYDSKSGFPYVLTSDLCLETKQGIKVVSVKSSSELGKLRVQEKLEIERRYWIMRGIEWNIVTENEINRTKASNIEWLSQAKDLTVFGMSESTQSACCEYFLESYRTACYTLAVMLKEVESAFGLIAGMGLNIYKYLAYWKRIVFDVDKKVNLAEFGFNPVLSGLQEIRCEH